MEFQISSIVVLKSGGPNMVIRGIFGDNQAENCKVQCLWLNEFNKIQFYDFSICMLKLVHF